MSVMLSVKKALLSNYDVKSFNLDGFCMECLKDSIYYKSFTNVLKIVLTLFHDQADAEHGFSLNKELSCWKQRNKFDWPTFHKRSHAASKANLIVQWFSKDHMLLNDYHPHNVSIAKELIRIVRSSNAAYKQALKQKRIEKESRKRSKAS